MIKRFGLLATALALASSVSAAPAFAAGSQTPTLSVSANVITNCTTMSSTSLSFGDYDPLSTSALNAPTAATFSTNCSSGSTVNFTLDGGKNYSNVQTSFAGDRALSDGTQYLAYQLYQDNSYTSGKAWAFNTSTGAGTTNASETGHGTASTDTANTWSVYGQIPAQQDAEASGTGTTYSDTVTVTLSY